MSLLFSFFFSYFFHFVNLFITQTQKCTPSSLGSWKTPLRISRPLLHHISCAQCIRASVRPRVSERLNRKSTAIIRRESGEEREEKARCNAQSINAGVDEPTTKGATEEMGFIDNRFLRNDPVELKCPRAGVLTSTLHYGSRRYVRALYRPLLINRRVNLHPVVFPCSPIERGTLRGRSPRKSATEINQQTREINHETRPRRRVSARICAPCSPFLFYLPRRR
jgi:hypothetical protein